MVQNALFILKDENLPLFKHNAIERAKVFDITAILPRYESFYEKVLALSISKDLIDQSNNIL